MKRVAQVIRLKPEAEAEYIRYHAEVWPTVLSAIDRCHIRNYSIFLRDGLLFAYFEYHGTNYAADIAVMAADPDTCCWWSIMDPMQSAYHGAKLGEKWITATEVSITTDLSRWRSPN